MKRAPFLAGCAAVLAFLAGAGCGGSSSGSPGIAAPSISEVAVSVVSGAVNVSGGSALGWNGSPAQRPSLLERIRDELGPVHAAAAATWTCTGGTLDPSFAGPGRYAYTPVSCSVAWNGGKTGSSAWSGVFDLDYGPSCDATHARPVNQAAACEVTRTTGAGGNTRTVTDPRGSSYAVDHDTHGAGTGWDTSVTPAPTDDGVIVTCGAGGCGAGGTLAVSGSHLVGTVTRAAGTGTKVWDHTVSTPAGPLTFTVAGGVRTFSGAVTVQHNLAHFTAVSTFDAVGYGEPGCCFPTTGSISTVFQGGPLEGVSETLTFSGVCGEATLDDGGTTSPVTLMHCL
jgi:hypothetical protein